MTSDAVAFDMSTFALFDWSEIRTRATEVTGALNQRLRPLGHPAYQTSLVQFVECELYYIHCI